MGKKDTIKTILHMTLDVGTSYHIISDDIKIKYDHNSLVLGVLNMLKHNEFKKDLQNHSGEEC